MSTTRDIQSAVCASKLPPHLRALLMVMAHLADHDTGEAWYGQAAIGDALGVDARTVRRRLADLAEITDSPVRVQTERRFKANGDPDTNLWRLVLTTGHPRPVVASPEDAGVLSSPPTRGRQRPTVRHHQRTPTAPPEDTHGRHQRTPTSSDPLSDPLKDLSDGQSRQAAQPALSDADLVWSKLSQGTKRKLTPQRESAILDALKQLGTVDALISYLDAAKAKTGKDWTAALASGEPSRIFSSYALELFATEGKLPASPKAERPDPPEVREAFTKVRDKYFAEFELARGTKPAFGGDDGRAIKQLLSKCGVESNPQRAAERACDAVAGCFADSWGKQNGSIQTIARDPNRWIGRVPRVQQGGEHQEFRLHKRSPANPQPDGRPLSDFAEGWTNG